MAELDVWLDWLTSIVGIAENPKGSNRTPIGEEYGWNGVAWCCETQSLAALHAFGRKVLWTAGVADAAARARAGENGMDWIAAHADVRTGDLPCYDFKGHGNPADMHIGGCVNPGTQAKFETIEGNLGDRVQRLWRDRTYVFGFIRLPFPTAQQPQGPVATIGSEDTVKFHYAKPDNSDQVFLVSLAAAPRPVVLFKDAEYWATKEGHTVINEGDHDLGADGNHEVRKGVVLDAKGRALFGLPV